ncbi:hypothetical protein BE21_37040 [Sorangium cellulosum]|uniref:Uncharacterized protein n=1 Tax=Sorangium cellulosum TaxID=56 RepID=A0A150TMX2_SORCE|nr:hypothetical protein BE21_37040 [Sorangium cellulosum]
MSAVQGFSEALCALAERAPIRRACDRRTLAKLAPPGCPPRWTEAADLLLALTQDRGLPLLGDYDFGALAEFDCSFRRHRSGPPDLVIARHASGRRVLLTQREGAVYLGRYEKRLCSDLRAFLERLAAELSPTPPLAHFSIHWRAGDEARKLANKLRAAENGAASALHDTCWSDDRWFIVRDRAAARRFEDLPALLAAARAAGAELGLHDGRAEAMLVEDLQRVPRGAQLHQAAGIAEISIEIAEGRRIVQALHYGDVATERAEWEDGELLVQRTRPATELFAPIPELQEYLFARRIHRLDRFRRSEEDLRRLFGGDLWPVLSAVERDHGGVIAEDDFAPWSLLGVAPLIAPGYVADTVAGDQRIRDIQGKPVRQVGKVDKMRWLCIDEEGRCYVTGSLGDDLEPGGDDIESALLRLALDWKLQRWRTEASMGGFLQREGAERVLKELHGAAERKLDTFGHTYHSGPGFMLRHRKAVLGLDPYFQLITSSTKRFCELLRPLAAAGRPVRVLQDTESFPTDEELAACAQAGVVISDH